MSLSCLLPRPKFLLSAFHYHLLTLLLLFFSSYAPAVGQQLLPTWAEASPLTTGFEGNNANTSLYQTAIGPKNSIYVAGGLHGTATFGSLPPTQAHAGAYIGRLADNGQWQWVKTISSDDVFLQPIYITDLAADKLGNVFVSAVNNFRDTTSVSFGPYLLKGSNFLAKLNSKGEWLWARSYGSLTLNSICPDGNGGVYIGGGYSKAFAVDSVSLPDPQINPGLYHTAAYTGRVNSNGVLLSAARVGTSGTCVVSNLQVTQQGELMVAGELYAGPLRLAPSMQVVADPAARETFFVARLASNGTTWRWLNSFYGTGSTYLSGLTLDRAGNAYIHGDMYGTTDFARLTSGNRPVGRQYIARLSNSGQWNWAVGVNHDTYGPGSDRLVATASGDLYFCSTSRDDSVRAGTGWLRGPSPRNGAPWGMFATSNQCVPWGYVAKLRGATGQLQWGVTAPSFAMANSEIALDSLEQRLLVTGYLWPSHVGSSFNATTKLTSGKNTGFLTALDISTKQWLWATAQKAGGGSEGQQIVADGSGNLTVSGLLAGDCSFGNIKVSAPHYGAFIARRNSEGHWLWAKAIPGVDVISSRLRGGGRSAMGLTVDPSGNSYVSGIISDDTAYFDNIKVAPRHRKSTFFIAKMSPTGQWLWAKPLRAPIFSGSWLSNMAADAAGNLIIQGNFIDSLAIDSTVFRSTYSPITRRRTSDTYLARFSPVGKLLWLQIIRGTDSWGGGTICADRNGGALMVNSMDGDTIRLGTHVVVSTASRRVAQYVAAIDSTGAWQWVLPMRTTASPHSSAPGSVKLKKNGDLLVLMYPGLGQYFLDTITIGTSDSRKNGPFIACLSGNTRKWKWATSILAYNNTSFSNAKVPYVGIELDAEDQVIAAGNFIDPLVLDSTLTFSTTSDAEKLFVAQLDTVGHWNWALTNQETDLPGQTQNRAFTTWKDRIYLTGAYTDYAQFGPFALPRNGDEMGYLVRIAPPSVTASGEADLWPNPTYTTATLRLTAPSTGQPLYILDAIGRRIREQPFPAGTTEAVLSVQDLAPGMYFVRCGTLAKRLIVRP